MQTYPDVQTDCRCASCRQGIAQYVDPQISRSRGRATGPEFCPNCFARILEARASGIALELHGLLSEISSTGVELSAHAQAMLTTIESWQERSCGENEDTGNIVTGRF